MEENARIDYFRSELLGKLDSSNKKLADDIAAVRAEIRQLTDRLDKLTREVKNVELSVSSFTG